MAQIDINDFDAIRIGLASSKQIRDWSLGRGHEARDDQLPNAQARARRPLLRAHLRSDQGLGVLLRQVQARPLQGHHLRALRRRGDAPEGASRAHGSHRPCRSGLAHLVLQGRPEPHRLPPRHRAARAREGARTSPPRSSPPSTARSAPPTSPISRTRSAPRRSRSTSTATSRSSPSTSGSRVVATTSRPARTRASTRTTSSGRAGSSTGRRSRRCRRSKRRARLPAASSRASPRRSRTRTRSGSASSCVRPRPATTAGWRRARSRPSRPRRRRSAPRSTRSARSSRRPRGSKKGAITKHLHKLLDALLAGEELSGDDAELVASIERKNLERAREIGNDLLADVLAKAEAGDASTQVRELAYDLCLVEGARKDDLDVVTQWALKVARDGAGHGLAPRRRPRGRRRRRPPARGDVEALPRARRRSTSSTTSRSSVS